MVGILISIISICICNALILTRLSKVEERLRASIEKQNMFTTYVLQVFEDQSKENNEQGA